MLLAIRQAFSSREVVVSVDCHFLQAQIAEQTGRVTDLVRNHAWFIPRPEEFEVHDRNQVALVAPTMTSSNYYALLALFHETLYISGAPFTLIAKHLKSQPKGFDPAIVRSWYEYWGEHSTQFGRNDMISMVDVRMHFQAAIIFPWDINMLSFDEMYSLELPLFLPTPAAVALYWSHLMLMTTVSGSNYPLYLLRPEHAQGSLVFNRASVHVHPPWFDEPMNADIHALLYWTSYTNWATWPGVTFFSGVADAVLRMSTADLGSCQAQMADFNKRTWDATQRWFHRSMSVLR
mmetsp:Transcript_46568/g.122976  ORF Transcript_46568/g.122976 Transcript_46568/m.122976 type:complete len:291 (+) Transcript_46568:1109-1981(+)